MNIKTLEIIIAVIDYGTMSKAAERMFVSQPNVSRTIRDVENSLGIKIFSRSTKKISLTTEGQVFEFYARRIINEYKSMSNRLKSGIVTLSVGSTVTVGHYLLDNYLKKIKKIYPEVSFEITINNTKTIETKLINSDIDFAFIEGEIKTKNLIEHTIDNDELIVVIGANYEKPIVINGLKDLEKLPWIRRESGSGERNQFEQMLRNKQIEPQVVYRASNLELIIQAVCNNYGFAIISRHAAQKHLQAKTMKEIKIPGYRCYRTIRMVIRREDQENQHFKQILHAIGQNSN